MRRVWSRAPVLFALLGVACSAPAATAADCPGGVAPTLDTCFAGEFFADCGGDGAAPRLACAGTDCRWFEGGCVARGYHASSCPADDICCLQRFPFPDKNATYLVLLSRFYSYGTLPWTRAREMNVGVTVDPELSHGSSTFSCDGPAPTTGPGPCDPGARAAAGDGHAAGTVWFVLYPAQFGGWAPAVEIDVGRDPPRARACIERYADFFNYECASGLPADCASAGTLTLDRLPRSAAEVAGLAGRLDATLGQLHIAASF